MKKLITIIIGLLVLVIAYFIISPYKNERICFGDVCPDNGGVYVLYKVPIPEFLCKKMGKYPVVGYGWGPVYAGCSPIPNMISR
jgi:hypothetical protein